ncbi:MAG: ATP-binding protein [Candidatus Woykebacteria bacterium]
MEATNFKPPEPPLIETFYNKTLPKVRIERFKQVNQFVILASVLYTFFIVLITPGSLVTEIIILTMAFAFGLLMFLYFHFTQDQEFTQQSNFYVALAGTAALLAGVQISGGIESPFIFFYILIIIYVGLTSAAKEALLAFLLIGLLIIFHALLPSIDILLVDRANSLYFFLATWGRILIISGYVLFIMTDLVKKDNILLGSNLDLEEEVDKLKKFNLLTKTYQSLTGLRGTMNYETLMQLIPMSIGKLLGAEVVLLFLKEDEDLNYVSSWSKKTEGVVKDAPLAECSIKHGNSCIVSKISEIDKIQYQEDSGLIEGCSASCADAISSLKTKYFSLIPLKVTDKPLGIIIMGFSEKRQFEWEEQEVIRIFSYTTVLAIENSRFYSKTRENFERYSAILSELVDAVVVVDKDNKIILFNQQAANLFDTKAADAVGKIVTEVLVSVEESGKKIPKEDTAIFKALGVNEVVNIPKRFYKKPGGDLLPATVSAKRIQDESARPVGVVLLVRNLTREIEFERARNEFIGVASRELLTPINDLRGFIKKVREDKSMKPSKVQENFLELSYNSTERLQRLVDDLLRVSQIDKGRISIKKKKVDLSQITKLTIEDFIYQARGKKQHLSYKASRNPVAVKADSTHVREVLANLIGNAIKYTKWGGEITVSHEAHKDKIITSIKDNGPLITKESLPNLFKKFYRDPKVASTIEGTGLGLYMVRELVNLMGGEVEVKSDAKNGVVFSFTLPKA